MSRICPNIRNTSYNSSKCQIIVKNLYKSDKKMKGTSEKRISPIRLKCQKICQNYLKYDKNMSKFVKRIQESVENLMSEIISNVNVKKVS